MNKLLTTIANDRKLGLSVIAFGFALSTIGSILIFTGVYYTALNKGAMLRDEEE